MNTKSIGLLPGEVWVFKGLIYEHKEWVLCLTRYGILKSLFMVAKCRSFTWRGMGV